VLFRLLNPKGGVTTVKVLVKKWGNSAALRIPAAVMAAAKVSLDQPVEVKEEDGRIVITPIREPSYDLDTLVDGITKKNRHDAVEIGPPMGREIW
jgi:antitoxin MazE